MKRVIDNSLSLKSTLSACLRLNGWNGQMGFTENLSFASERQIMFFCSSPTPCCRTKSLLFPKRWSWSWKTWSSGYILTSPSGDVASRPGPWRQRPWGGTDRGKLCSSTGSQPWTVGSTSKTFSRKRLTLVNIICTSKSNVWGYRATSFFGCRFCWKLWYVYIQIHTDLCRHIHIYWYMCVCVHSDYILIVYIISLTSKGPGNTDGQMNGYVRDTFYPLEYRAFCGSLCHKR